LTIVFLYANIVRGNSPVPFLGQKGIGYVSQGWSECRLGFVEVRPHRVVRHWYDRNVVHQPLQSLGFDPQPRSHQSLAEKRNEVCVIYTWAFQRSTFRSRFEIRSSTSAKSKRCERRSMPIRPIFLTSSIKRSTSFSTNSNASWTSKARLHRRRGSLLYQLEGNWMRRDLSWIAALCFIF
jgi:hypothetical protein